MKVIRTRVKLSVMLYIVFLLILSACSSSTSASSDRTNSANSGNATNLAPAGYKKFMVFMGNGEFSPSSMNDMMSMMSGADFFRHMDWNDDQITQHKAQALAFFKLRYGLDFSKSNQIGHAMFLDFTNDPHMNLRAYSISDMNVPRSGWFVDDGGWAVYAVKGSMTLYGTYGGATGTQVPAGTALMFGYYKINTGSTPIIIAYQAIVPMFTDMTGDSTVICQVSNDQFGKGMNQGVMGMPEMLPNGNMKYDVREVMTFPGY